MGAIRKPPPVAYLVGTIASLFFLISHGSEAISEGFSTGRIIRVAFWTVFLVVCLVLLLKARKAARDEEGQHD